MPRKIFEMDPHSFYHVTCRSINKDWFSMPLDQVWEIMAEELFFIKHGFGLKIFLFVLMDNHYHLLLRSPEGNLSEAMCFFQSQTSRRIVKSQNRINHLWVRRFKRTKISNFHYFINTYKYIYQNPLRAQKVSRCEDYQFSTLRGLLGMQRLLIPIEFDSVFFDFEESNHRCDFFEWINCMPTSVDVQSMARALKHSSFKYPKVGKKMNRLESEFL